MASSHTVIRDMTSTIAAHAQDSILRVLQQNSPVKTMSMSNQKLAATQFDPREIQLAISQSLGVTALSLANDPMFAGNILLKNDLRSEMGGIPTTHLVGMEQNVGQYRSTRAKGEGKAKCSRASRNGLLNLCSSDEEMKEKTVSKHEKAKRKRRIIKKLLSWYQDENDSSKRTKIKYAMKALDDNNHSVQNDMINFTFDVYSEELKSFDSMDTAMNILNIAENESE